MKITKLILLLAFVCAPVLANAQVSTLTAFSAQTYAKATTSTDTSATLSIGGYPYATLQITSTGSDSSVIYQNVDAYINGGWALNILRDTLTLGRPSGYTLESTKGQVRYRTLRNPAGTDLLGGATSIRIRNKHASGAGDSTSALTYTQKIIMRKP